MIQIIKDLLMIYKDNPGKCEMEFLNADFTYNSTFIHIHQSNIRFCRLPD